MLSESAGIALGGIINKFKSLKGIGFRTFEKIYLTGVTSVAEYAADIWGFKDISACNNVKNRTMCYSMGVHRFAPIVGMRGDFGWICTKYTCRKHQLMLRFWNRLMDANRLTKHIFNYDYHHCTRNWCSEVKNIVQNFDKVELFNNRNECDIDEISLHMLQKDSLDSQEVPKLRTYVIFKSELHVEDYLYYVTNRRAR